MDAATHPGAGRQPDFYDDLDKTLDQAWQLLGRGVADRKSPFHQAQVATVAADGGPAVRTVVLRGADRARGTVRFHTDRRSRKYGELRANPAVAMHLYDHGKKIQLRLRGTALLHAGDGFAESLWRGMRDMSKACYRQPEPPGARVREAAAVDAAEPLADAEGLRNFVAVEVRLSTMEWLYLAARGHRRALFDLAVSPPAATWLAP